MKWKTAVLSLLLTPALGHATVGADAVKTAPDRSWVTVTGTVAATAPHEFTLDFGDGLVTVEMDDWDRYDEVRAILAGDIVTVRGRIDADLYEARTIEADSVYVFGANTFYYASDADEEGGIAPPFARAESALPEGTWLSVSGTVESIDGREFQLRTEAGTIRVDTRAMSYNPLDDVGKQQVDADDRVMVGGRLDGRLFERREIDAELIVSLERDTKKSER